jgi:hypothetical protein
MFFLLRMAFWLGLVLVLLPRDQTPDSNKLPKVDASQAISAAGATISDMSQFCTRQPMACEIGGKAATEIGHRAQDGARKIYHIIIDRRSADQTGAIGSMDGSRSRTASENTLTDDDLHIEWHQPASSVAAVD